MRANVPTPENFEQTLPVKDEPAVTKLTPEQKALAKLGNSQDWAVYTDYLRRRIDHYKTNLFDNPVTGMKAEDLGNQFLAAYKIVEEFEGALKEVERTIKMVNEAAKDGPAGQ